MNDIERDELLETIAALVEQPCITDMWGALAKKKRDREDSCLRRETAIETRKSIATKIRSMKVSNRNDPIQILKMIRDFTGTRQDILLRDAWPLTWQGLVDIECNIKCNSNSVPPETTYKITITEKGFKLLNGEINE